MQSSLPESRLQVLEKSNKIEEIEIDKRMLRMQKGRLLSINQCMISLSTDIYLFFKIKKNFILLK